MNKEQGGFVKGRNGNYPSPRLDTGPYDPPVGKIFIVKVFQSRKKFKRFPRARASKW